jgi:DNA-binding Lrp family transcriptional regulator
MVNSKKEDILIKDILEILQKELQPISTQDIAERLARPWHSIQTRCLRLQVKGDIDGFRIGRINLWKISSK